MRDLFDNVDSGWAIFGIVVLILALAFGVFCLESWLVMLLWNAIIPNIFVGVGAISFWWAAGIKLLCSLLFGAVRSVSKGKD